MTEETNILSPLFEQHKADFEHCEEIIRNYSKSFYAAFSTLPKQRAMSVYAIYAFCRKADDMVDVYRSPADLAKLKQELQAFEKGAVPDDPMWRALEVVFATYEIDIQAFYDMLEGQRRDLNFEQPLNQQELEEYCYYVAGTVGLMLLPLLSDEPEKIRDEALALGRAMQITNILRDIGEDVDHKRIYLPVDVMEKYHYSNEMLANHILNADFINLWEYEAAQAENYYEQASQMLPLVREDARKPLLLSALLYHEILEVIRADGYQCFKIKQYVDRDRKIALNKLADEILLMEFQDNSPYFMDAY